VHKFKPSTIAQNILIPNGETPLPKFSPTQTLVLSVHKFKPCTIAQNILIPNGKTPLPKFSPIQTLALQTESTDEKNDKIFTQYCPDLLPTLIWVPRKVK